jgi:hypothetical protein
MPITEPTLALGPGELPRERELRQALHLARPDPDCGLYALLDGARIPKLWVMLRELRVEHACLLRESPNENLTHVAPLLARFDVDGDLVLWLAMQNTALEATLFLFASATPGELYRHLRRFLLVLDAAGKENYLRFYDPRVLRPFVESSTDAEKRPFFGPIHRFLAYDAERSEAAGEFLFARWDAPAPGHATGEVRPPSATDKFRLSQQQERAFDVDCMERYDRRCVDFLRQRYAPQLEKTTDEALRALVNQAKQLGPKLGLPSGRDVAIIAELLVLGFPFEMRQKIEGMALKDRPRAIQLLRDRMMTNQPAAVSA